MKRSMCWLIGFALLGLAATVSEAPAQSPSVSIETEYLGTVEVQLDAAQAVGPVRIVNSLGGTLKGPKINGTFVAPSGDWLTVMPDGSLRMAEQGSGGWKNGHVPEGKTKVRPILGALKGSAARTRVAR